MEARTWDVFCRVIDNYGDIGVCWRLAADLGSRGAQVRLWVDDASALAWMAPGGASGVTVVPWTDPPAACEPGDVVVEAFGCELPEAFVSRMADRRPAPRWINLEYLSAESYVERSHRLPSPQSGGPGAGLVKHFFYPGFTPATGGLLREPGLIDRRRMFDADAWLRAAGIASAEGERRVSLFCYDGAPVESLIAQLADRPTLLLAAAGPAAPAVRRHLGPAGRRGELRAVELPALTQVDYDHLLWSCELNFVRGEDSFVRAQWAGAPFVWQIYPQADGVHAAKLTAFLDHFLASEADPSFGPALRALWAGWNGLGPMTETWPPAAAWRDRALGWRARLCEQPDLTTQLLAFVARPGL